jgi:hypothetical protein
MARSRCFAVAILAAPLLFASACDAVTGAAVGAADFAGAKADAHCDRRFVTAGGEPAPFCQEVMGTLAAAEFADDCRTKHKATADPGPCPRAKILAGCKLLKKNDDDSNVWDWYYDVSDLVDAGPDAGWVSESLPRSVSDVAASCADRTRYEEGAELVVP